MGLLEERGCRKECRTNKGQKGRGSRKGLTDGETDDRKAGRRRSRLLEIQKTGR